MVQIQGSAKVCVPAETFIGDLNDLCNIGDLNFNHYCATVDISLFLNFCRIEVRKVTNTDWNISFLLSFFFQCCINYTQEEKNNTDVAENEVGRL